jgi:hypothetical protein
MGAMFTGTVQLPIPLTTAPGLPGEFKVESDLVHKLAGMAAVKVEFDENMCFGKPNSYAGFNTRRYMEMKRKFDV